jgi:hypothetical protein
VVLQLVQGDAIALSLSKRAYHPARAGIEQSPQRGFENLSHLVRLWMEDRGMAGMAHVRVHTIAAHGDVQGREGTDYLNGVLGNSQLLAGFAHSGVGQSLVLRLASAPWQRDLSLVSLHCLCTARERQHPLTPLLVQQQQDGSLSGGMMG